MSETLKQNHNLDEVRTAVRDHYARAAARINETGSGCCGSSAGSHAVTTAKDPITRDLYAETEVAGLPADAVAASLGCGNPTALADLRPGETVLDLGSGGGIDVFLSARRVGPTGKAYGLDMTDAMLDLARRNQRRAGLENVEFLKGTMEEIPLPDGSVDVVISNCVINLSGDKDRVLSEIFRVLRPGGRLAVTDVVVRRPLPEAVRRSLELWAGCVAGALTEDAYRSKLADAGFAEVTVEPVRTYTRADAGELLEGGACCGSAGGCGTEASDGAEVPASGAAPAIDPADLDGALMSAFVRAVKS